MFLLPELHFIWYDNFYFLVLVISLLYEFFINTSSTLWDAAALCHFFTGKTSNSRCFFATRGVKEIQSVNFNFIINVIIGCFISYEGGQPTMQCSHGWNIGQAPEGYYYYYNATTQGKWQLLLFCINLSCRIDMHTHKTNFSCYFESELYQTTGKFTHNLKGPIKHYSALAGITGYGLYWEPWVSVTTFCIGESLQC